MPRPLRLLQLTRRRVLAHRRLLAFVLTGLAVATGLQAVAPAAPRTVSVTVAARDLPGGTTVATDDVTRVRLPPDAVPDGAVARPVGRALAAPLRRGEPVTDARLVGPGLAEAHPGRVAVPVRLPDPGLVELLRPGHRIDLFAVDPSGASGSDAGDETGDDAGEAERVASGVLVLAVPEIEADAAVASGLGGRLVVIAVAASSVAQVTEASVRSFLTYAFAS